MISALCVLLAAAMAATPSPREALSAEMILREVAQNGVSRRSSSIGYPGQCRRFQADSFAIAAQGYTLADFAGVELYLPLEHAAAADSGRNVGACWYMPEASTGNGFVQVASFDYNRDLGLAENKALALAFLRNVQAGDVMQMLASYNSGGRGTHTILLTRPYDPRLGKLYWVDSNFANTRVDGILYGEVRAYQCWDVEDVVNWLTRQINNGATLYRVSDNVIVAP